MSYNETQPYNYPSSQYNDFDSKGHPGKFHKVITCTTGTTTFTGSNFGVGGVIVSGGTSGSLFFSNGGSMPLTALSASNSVIFEFSPSSVSVVTGTVYALIRNQMIR